MREITVKIEWDRPETEEEWLDAEGIANIMHHYYKDIKFKVSETLEVFGARIEVRDELTASEALFGFVGWLTTRPEPTVLSGHHDAGAPADRVGEFMKANQLSEPRDGWQHKLVWVEEDKPLPMDPRRVRWSLYNLAFRVFGNTRLWPALGWKIWN